MSNRELISVGGNAVAEAAIKKFSAGLRGPLIRPDDSDYESARWSWNRAVDRHPGMIVRCVSSEDVVRTVNFARSNELLLAVRSGGHSFAGHSTCDAGVVLDLSSMRVIHVNRAQRVARAQAGMKVGEFDRATHALGLASVMGGCEEVGIAGFTLGGGQGLLSGCYGLGCDNLLSVDVVTADGRLLRASTGQNSDLFWGMRGGAGNFGIATTLEYRLHPVRTIYGGTVAYPITQTQQGRRPWDDHSHRRRTNASENRDTVQNFFVPPRLAKSSVRSIRERSGLVGRSIDEGLFRQVRRMEVIGATVSANISSVSTRTYTGDILPNRKKVFASGPELPLNENVRRRFYGEI